MMNWISNRQRHKSGQETGMECKMYSKIKKQDNMITEDFYHNSKGDVTGQKRNNEAHENSTI